MPIVRRHASLIAPLALALLPACGEAERPLELGALRTAPSLAELVPLEADAYLQIASLAELGLVCEKLDRSFDGGVAEQLEMWLAELGLDAPGIDTQRPVGFAASFAAAPMPVLTLIIPATDVAACSALQATLQLTNDPVVIGEHIVLSALPDYADVPKGSPLASALPESQFCVRVDLDGVRESFGPLIESSLQEFEGEIEQVAEMQTEVGGMDIVPLMALYLSGARALVEHTEMVELGFRVDGDDMALELALGVRAGSPLAGFGGGVERRWDRYSRLLGDEHAFALLASANMSDLGELFEPYLQATLQAYPVTMRRSLEPAFARLDELWATLGDNFAASFSLGKDGLAGTYYVQLVEPERFMQLQSGMLDSLGTGEGSLLSQVAKEEREVDGHPVTTFTMDFDARAVAGLTPDGEPLPEAQLAELDRALAMVYGEDGLRLSYVPVGAELVLAIGGDDDSLGAAIAELGSGGGLPNRQVVHALERLQECGPVLVYTMDVPRFVYDLAAWPLITEMDEATREESAQLRDALHELSALSTFYAGATDDAWRAGVAVDLASFARFIEIMEDL